MRRWWAWAAMTAEERGEWMRSDTIDRHRDPEDGWWYMDQALAALRDADRRAAKIEVLRDRIRPWLQGATDANPTFETALEMVEARIAALEAEEE